MSKLCLMQRWRLKKKQKIRRKIKDLREKV